MKPWTTALFFAVPGALACGLLISTTTSSGAAAPTAPRPALGARGPESTQVRAGWESSSADPGRQELPRLPPPAVEKTASETLAEARDQLGERFYSEGVDSAWTQETTRQLERTLPALLPAGSAMRRVECRSTMCRVESTHPGLDEFGVFVRSAFVGDTRVSDGGFFAGLLSDPQPGQPVTTVAYVARKGHSLPMPERPAQ